MRLVIQVKGQKGWIALSVEKWGWHRCLQHTFQKLTRYAYNPLPFEICNFWRKRDMETNKSEINILMAHWRGLSGIVKVSDYLSVSRENYVILGRLVLWLTAFFFFFFSYHYINLFFFEISSVTRLVYLGVFCCYMRWGIRFHMFFGHFQRVVF